MDQQTLEFTLGAHDARLKAVEGNVTEIREDVKQILEVINRSKGSWKMLVGLGAATAGLVEAGHYLATLFHRG